MPAKTKAAFQVFVTSTRDAIETFVILTRIIVPVVIVTEVLSRLGVIKAIAPALSPIMGIFGLPPELGLAWLTGLILGIWPAIPLVFSLVPVSELTVADVSIFASLLLFAHALPVEQQIVRKAGPGFWVTNALRLGGGVVYAIFLHKLTAATGWLSQPVSPAWIPLAATPDWYGFFLSLLETLWKMLLVVLALFWGMEVLKRSGIMKLLMAAMAPILRLAGVNREASEMAAVGLFLGLSFGGGLLIKEARAGHIPPRQVFIVCAFMGFIHSILEDTIIMLAIGADFTAIAVLRLAFSIVASAIVALVVVRMSDGTFYRFLFPAGGEKARTDEARA